MTEQSNPQWWSVIERSRLLEEGDEVAPCIRCGRPHSGPLSVCDDCDRHPRSSAVDELLAEVRELREELAAFKAELEQIR